ncbi:MAG: universal stress protein [Chlorobiaceae bacterium]|jgi:universal stress protein A|nr:universal stress protein [Chlorobiaceae bacterium]NTW09915.1 universal stress protein [Chlorobiaceae bacterium]
MFKIRTILCPIDFSDASLKEVSYAREFASCMGATVFLLNVVDVPAEVLVNNLPLEEKFEKEESEKLEAIKQRLASEGMKIDGAVEFGNPEEVILEKARELGVNLIIMGSHCKTGFSRLFLGSVTEHVMRKADCPVLVVKSHETEFIGE